VPPGICTTELRPKPSTSKKNRGMPKLPMILLFERKYRFMFRNQIVYTMSMVVLS
jgi:hypothetical protein